MASNVPSGGFLPPLREYLANNSATFEELKLQCRICFRTILPKSLQGNSGTSAEEEDAYCDSGCGVLACGHFFGYACIRGWQAHLAAGGHPRPCPVCGQGSSVGIKNKSYHVTRIEDFRMAPKCLAEGSLFPNAATLRRTHKHFLDQLPIMILENMVDLGTLSLGEMERMLGNRQNLVNFERSFVVVLQLSWSHTIVLRSLERGISLMWTGKTADFSFEDHRLVPKIGSQNMELPPPCTYPLYATAEEGNVAISEIIKREISHSAEVWTPRTVGFGIGVRDGYEALDQHNLAEAMVDEDFVEALGELLWPLLRDAGRRETVSTLLR